MTLAGACTAESMGVWHWQGACTAEAMGVDELVISAAAAAAAWGMRASTQSCNAMPEPFGHMSNCAGCLVWVLCLPWLPLV